MPKPGRQLKPSRFQGTPPFDFFAGEPDVKTLDPCGDDAR